MTLSNRRIYGVIGGAVIATALLIAYGSYTPAHQQTTVPGGIMQSREYPIDTAPPVPTVEARSEATGAEQETMRAALKDLRSIVARCSAPRDRSLTPDCMTLLRSSNASLQRDDTAIASIPKSAAGFFDLGVAISLGQNCCSCDPKAAPVCAAMASKIASAEAALMNAKPVPAP